MSETIGLESRHRIAEILKGDDWREIDAVVIKMIQEAQRTCGVVKEDHRYWQGELGGLMRFRSMIYELGDPAKIVELEKEKEEEKEPERARMWSATGAIY